MEDYYERYGIGAFERSDETEDVRFYSRDRFVDHVDSTALRTIEDLIESLIVEENPQVLDLMASRDSHVRDSLGARITGLGLNEHELAGNGAISDYRLHDINKDPRLPFPDASFDAVICCLSVDYLTRPLHVFRDVSRVLKPGGLFLVIFSNRFFPQKAVKIWKALSEEDRVALVREYFELAGRFDTVRDFVSKDLPRPAADKFASLGIPSDPVYAVYADRLGGATRTRHLPQAYAEPGPSNAYKKNSAPEKTAAAGRCPHCGKQLEKWEVPQTPFTEWPSEYQFVCFNDHCTYFLRGWETMKRQGNMGSYRFMFDPVTRMTYPLPVLDKHSLRDGIFRDN